MQQNAYVASTCANMHKAGNRIALCANIIGGICILAAVAVAGIGVLAMLQMNAMTASFPSGANTAFHGTGIPFHHAGGVVFLLAVLLYGILVAFVGFIIIAFGQWMKWLQIGQAEALDAQTRIAITMTRNQQQQ